MIASSYQAVSGSGARAIDELRSQVQAAAANQPPIAEIYPHPIAFNLLPHVDSFLPGGYTKEEMKMQNEGRRIMHLPDFRASVTCVRVPVYRAHSVAVSAEFESAVSVEEAHEVLAKAPGWSWSTNQQKIVIRCRFSPPGKTTAKSAASGAIAHSRMGFPFGFLAISS